jgi:hypothetical protein
MCLKNSPGPAPPFCPSNILSFGSRRGPEILFVIFLNDISKLLKFSPHIFEPDLLTMMSLELVVVVDMISIFKLCFGCNARRLNYSIVAKLRIPHSHAAADITHSRRFDEILAAAYNTATSDISL